MLLKMILVAAAVSAASAATPDVVPSQNYAHPQQLVAVDGARRLNLFCMGKGEPTVMFESGAGDGMVVWRHVQAEIAKVTRACAYDRAGYGFSDASARASDARNTVDDFHRLLSAAHIHTPIVYVGHSIAGFYGPLFAATYPNDVAGIVFVDPAFSDQWQKMIAPIPPANRAHVTALFEKIVSDGQQCLALAQKGALMAPKTKEANACVDTSGGPEKLDATIQAAMAAQATQPKPFAAQVSEYESFIQTGAKISADEEEVESAHPTFGDKPVVVLSHSKASPLPGITPAQSAAAEKAWSDGHDRLARLSTHGSNTVVPNTGHYIQIDDPGAVIAAVKKVVTEVRAAK
jgi:pimeloyl-ACP methyl ester carboxylesterase